MTDNETNTPLEKAIAAERERCRQAVLDGLKEFGAIPGGIVDSCCAYILLRIMHQVKL